MIRLLLTFSDLNKKKERENETAVKLQKRKIFWFCFHSFWIFFFNIFDFTINSPTEKEIKIDEERKLFIFICFLFSYAFRSDIQNFFFFWKIWTKWYLKMLLVWACTLHNSASLNSGLNRYIFIKENEMWILSFLWFRLCVHCSAQHIWNICAFIGTV